MTRRLSFLLLTLSAGLVATSPLLAQPLQVSVTAGGNSVPVTAGAILSLTAADQGQPILANVTVRYAGSSVGNIAGISVLGSSEITLLAAPQLPVTLTPGSSLTFTLQYLPTSGNAVTAQVGVVFSEGVQTPGGPPLSTSTFAFGLAGTSPRLTYSYFFAPSGSFADLNSGDRITFPSTNVGSSMQAVVSILNRGTAPGTLRAVAVSGPAFQLSGAPSDTTPLAPGQQTSFTVTFTPQATGGSQGLLTVGLASSIVTFSLAGTGTSTSLTASYSLADGNVHPLSSGTAISFPPVDVNGSTTASITIANLGSGAGTINNVAISGAGFQLGGLPLLPATVPAGQSVKFSIVFNPAQAGSFTGTFRIDISGASISGTLAGATNAPNLTASYALADGNNQPLASGAAIAFPSVDVNATTTASITILNQGTGTGTLTSVAISGAAFRLTGLPLIPSNIPAGQNVKLGIVFAPTQAGTFTGTFRIDLSSGSISGTLTGSTSTPNFSLSYTLADGSPRPIASGTVISFPSADLNATTTASVTIQNTGQGAGTVSAVTVSGTGFQLTGLPPLPATIPAGQALKFGIVFAPTQAGTSSGFFSITLNNTSISGTLNGFTTPPNFTASYTIGTANAVPLTSGSLITFPPIDINGTTLATVTLVNLGGAGNITNITVTGAGYQAVGLPVMPFTLLGNQGVKFGIQFTATQAGTFTGTFRIDFSNGNSISGSLTESTAASNLSLSYIDPDTNSTIPLPPNGTLPFPNTLTGAASTITVVVANSGAGTGFINSVTLGGTSPAAFQLVNLPTTPIAVAPSQTARFGIRFSPQQQQSFTATLAVNLNGQTQTVNLAAQAIAAQFTYASITSAGTTPFLPDGTLTIADTSVGQTTSVTISITNAGTADGQIAGFAVTGQGFTLTNAPAAAITLKPNASLQFTLNFAPTQPGAATGRLTIGAATFNLTSNGIGPKLTFTFTNAAATNPVSEGGTVIFTPTTVGNNGTLNFSIQNTGTSSTTLSSINLTTSSVVFALQKLPSLPMNLDPGSSVSFVIGFTPNNTGTLTAAMAVNSSTFTLSGTGTAPTPLPGYQFQGPSGTQPPSQQPSVGLTLSSAYPLALRGSLTLSFISSVFTDDPSIQFASGGRTINFTIPANTTQALFNGTATAVPLQTGTTAGNIVITPSFAMQSGFDMTPASPNALTLTIQRAAPQLLSASVTSQTLNSFTVILSGYSTSRNLRQLDIQISPKQGSTFSTSHLSIDVSSSSTSWFQGTASQGFGGAFLVAIPFTLQNGNTTTDLVHLLQSLSITATNDVGASSAISVSIP